MAYILFIGGVRSGKSRLAQAWTEAASPERLLIATCHAKDAEMAARIACHKKSRPEEWLCLEEPLEPMGGLQLFRSKNQEFNGSLMLDSIGMWIANLMAQNLASKEILRRITLLAAGLEDLDLPCSVVSDECGLGFVPTSAVARKYGDILGTANQLLAQKAHSVIWVSCGLPLPLKGSLPAVLDRVSRGLN